MQRLTEEIMKAGWAGRVISSQQLKRLVDGTAQRRYNLVNRALKHGELLQLRRGLYLLTPDQHNKPPHPFVLAQALHPGSVVSFETALAFHGWIPEAVPVTISLLPGRRKLQFDLGRLGLFRFYPLALQTGFFLQAVDRCRFSGQTALVAQPARALLDLVCMRKLEGDALSSLTQSMRIEPEALQSTLGSTWQNLRGVYRHKRMAQAIDVLQGESAA